MMSKNILTVIIPIYNQKEHIVACLSEILKFRHNTYSLEIILVDDGSTDSSNLVCRKYVEKYDFIKYYYQENKGVSAARNLGLVHASGKYIFFLDADDCLAPGTIKYVVEFFDTVYDETDLVTYQIETIYQGKKQKPHFRYNYLNKSGIYDLREYPYIGQTTMNIVVKNKFEYNILFDENQTFSEDQKYCCDVLTEKLKMGFCNQGKYLYYRSIESSSGKLSGSCYIFEQCMSFFETLFSKFEKVPVAFQGLFVNDIYWKMVNNILFPYHYDKNEYRHAINRICNLLSRCDNDVILNHPQIDFFEKYYLLRLKGENTLRCQVNGNYYSLCDNSQVILSENSMEMVVTKVFVAGKNVVVQGFLKTVFFQFYESEPTLCVIENNGALTKKIQLHPSAHNYYQSHEKTQCFWAACYSCDADKVKNFHFEVEVMGHWFPVHYYFMPLVPFSHKYQRYIYQKGEVQIMIDCQNEFHLLKVIDDRKKRIWLYYDCKGVASDNGLLQFEHDIKKKDGIKRYYIVSDIRQVRDRNLKNNYVFWGSKRHKKLFLKSEKIFAAFIEENNVIPFHPVEYDKYSGKFGFEIIYLQHGVLHIDMPWKYSPEKIMADKVVTSTVQETELFQKNGFRKENLWQYKMPRFDFIKPDRGGHKKKILFAPSWRAYLVGENINNEYKLLYNKFVHSTYFVKIQEFLRSERLNDILEQNGYDLDVKLHPIFSGYQKQFLVESGKIKFIDSVKEELEYGLFITDFSSFLYNFVYQEIPILSFIPDIVEFKAGMNGYRNLNYKEEYWNFVIIEPEKLVEAIGTYIKTGNGIPFQVDFFTCDNSREKIYQACVNTDN